VKLSPRRRKGWGKGVLRKIEWYDGLLKTTEINGGWDFQKLGYSFSKGHLVG